LNTNLLSDEDEAVGGIPRFWFPASFKEAEFLIQGKPTLPIFYHALELNETLERNGDAKFRAHFVKFLSFASLEKALSIRVTILILG
jgi:hypothetical protein